MNEYKQDINLCKRITRQCYSVFEKIAQDVHTLYLAFAHKVTLYVMLLAYCLFP